MTILETKYVVGYCWPILHRLVIEGHFQLEPFSNLESGPATPLGSHIPIIPFLRRNPVRARRTLEIRKGAEWGVYPAPGVWWDIVIVS